MTFKASYFEGHLYVGAGHRAFPIVVCGNLLIGFLNGFLRENLFIIELVNGIFSILAVIIFIKIVTIDNIYQYFCCSVRREVLEPLRSSCGGLMSDTTSTILVVDDEEAILESVTMSLEFENYATATASTGAEALKKYQELHPDLVILDIMLPDQSGFDVCRSIRALGDVPILFLSAKDQLEDKVLGLDTGGDDYLSKPFRFRELLARVRALLRRSGHNTRKLTYGSIVLDLDAHIVMNQGHPVQLTPREYELLEMFMRKPHQVFTRQQILKHLWDWDSTDCDTNVVEVYICALRNKLSDESRALLRTVRGVGYALG